PGPRILFARRRRSRNREVGRHERAESRRLARGLGPVACFRRHWRALCASTNARSLAQRFERHPILGRGRPSRDSAGLRVFRLLPSDLSLSTSLTSQKGVALALKPIEFDPGTAGRTARRALIALMTVVAVIILSDFTITRIDTGHLGIRI